MSFNGQISGSLAPQGAKTGSVSGNIGAVTPAIRDGAVTTAKLADEAVTTAKIADAAVTIAKLAADVTALINSKGDASDVATLQSDVAALQTITAGLGTASTYGVLNALTQATGGVNVLDAAQGKALGDRLTTAEGDIASLNDGFANLGTVKVITASVNSSGYTDIPYPSGFSAANTVILGASMFTKYNSWVDFTYDTFTYSGDLNFTASGIRFTPKTAGNATQIRIVLWHS